VAIVTSTLLLLSWFAYDGMAASIADFLLNPLRDYLVRAAAWYLSRAINGTIEQRCRRLRRRIAVAT
jgi:hypothetical protein